MKNLFISTIFAFGALQIYAVNPEYYKAMQANIHALDTVNTSEGLVSVAARFEQISKVEVKEWLPLYYAAFGYLKASFSSKDDDKRDLMMDHALELIDLGLKLRPSESELYTMMGYTYIGKMNINPMIRAMVYMPKAKEVLEKAKQLNPSNPRCYYLLASITYYTPEFFGGGKENAMPQLKEAMDKFNQFAPADSISPDWGKTDCLKLMNKK